MRSHKTYYIREETSSQLDDLSKHYKKSKSQIIRELIAQRFNAVTRHKIKRLERIMDICNSGKDEE